MKTKTLTDQIIVNWDNWDQLDTIALQFYNGTLVIDVGDVKAGTKIECCVIDFEKGIVEIVDNQGDNLSKMSIKLSLEPITE
jgi:hypothetical protein